MAYEDDDDDELVVDFDREADKRRLWAMLRRCKGKNRITVKQYRARRTSPQNRLYWGAIVTVFQSYLRGQGESLTKEEVHRLFGAKFLRRSIFDPQSGELIGETIASTAKLTTEEFGIFIDQCTAWLADMFDIVVPDLNGSMSFA